jgi:UDP-N-acetyl-2-amino-2-deoxyglucuronate dehydrogenase
MPRPSQPIPICGWLPSARGHEESSASLAREYAGAAKDGRPVKVYAHYEDMLADGEVDIVSECMPNFLHAKEAVAAFDAGKHLILEKPAAINREELALLKAASRKAGTKSVVSFVLRWHPLVTTIKNLLDRGAIGETYFAGFDYWHGIKTSFPSYQWIRQQEFAGGAMITGGCHAADLARYLKGEVAEVSAYSMRSRQDFDYPTTISATVKYCDGSLGRMSVSLDGICIPYQFNIDLLGTRGAIRDNRLFSQELFPGQKDFALIPGDTPNSGSVAHHPFKNEINDFVESILNGTPVLSDVEDACCSMELALAITESAQSGKPVLLSAADGKDGR